MSATPPVVDYARMKRLSVPAEKESVPIWFIVVALLSALFLFKRFRDHSLTKVSSSDSESLEPSSWEQMSDDS